MKSDGDSTKLFNYFGSPVTFASYASATNIVISDFKMIAYPANWMIFYNADNTQDIKMSNFQQLNQNGDLVSMTKQYNALGNYTDIGKWNLLSDMDTPKIIIQ